MRHLVIRAVLVGLIIALQNIGYATISSNLNLENDSVCFVAKNDTFNLPYGKTASLAVLDNDFCENAIIDSTTLEIIIGANTLLVEVDEDEHVIYYRQNEGYSSPDSIYYSICTTTGECSQAWAFINFYFDINYKPFANNDTVDVNWQKREKIDVLTNDYDGDDLLTENSVLIITYPEHGTLIITDTTGLFYYEPDSAYSGPDLFAYRLCDEKECDSAWVYIDVLTKPNEAPAAKNDTVRTSFNQAVKFFPLINDEDVDENLDESRIEIVHFPRNGNANIEGNGLAYEPTPGYEGKDSLAYNAFDTEGLSSQAWIFIWVEDNFSPIALMDTAYVFHDSISTIKVTLNDSDMEGDIAFVTLLSSVKNGRLSIASNKVDIVYSPEGTISCIDSFSYVLWDAYGKTDTSKVYLLKDPKKRSLLREDRLAVYQDFTSELDFYTNDDAHFDLSTFKIETYPRNGNVSYNQLTGYLMYTPDFGFLGKDSLVYMLTTTCDIHEWASIYIQVEDNIVPPQLYTPNADGENDYFVIENLERYAYTQLEVFNRWGSIVYQVEGYENDWNGIANMGSPVGNDVLPVGTYYYILNFGKDKERVKTKTGFVYILR